MAHAGKQYPVANRRDLSLNINTYRLAVATKYKWTVSGNTAPYSLALNGKTFKLDQIGDKWGNRITFGSQAIPVLGDLCTCEFAMYINDDGDTLTGMFKLFSASYGLLGACELWADPGVGYGRIYHLTGYAELPRPDKYNGNFPNAQSALLHRGWGP